MRNMKIPVENNLDEIVGELKRLGYKKDLIKGRKWVMCHELGYFSIHDHNYDFNVKLTTLDELKEMQNAK